MIDGVALTLAPIDDPEPNGGDCPGDEDVIQERNSGRPYRLEDGTDACRHPATAANGIDGRLSSLRPMSRARQQHVALEQNKNTTSSPLARRRAMKINVAAIRISTAP
jgi:hypothetical protein